MTILKPITVRFQNIGNNEQLQKFSKTKIKKLTYERKEFRIKLNFLREILKTKRKRKYPKQKERNGDKILDSPKPKRNIIKRNLEIIETNISHEHRCKSPKQNINKSNPTIYTKNYTIKCCFPQICKAALTFGNQLMQTITSINWRKKLYDHINRLQKMNLTTSNTDLWLRKKHFSAIWKQRVNLQLDIEHLQNIYS